MNLSHLSDMLGKSLKDALADILGLLPHLQSEMWLAVLFILLIVADLVFPKQSVIWLFFFGLGINLVLIVNSQTAEMAVSGLQTAPKAGKVLISISAMLVPLLERIFPNRKQKLNEFWSLLAVIVLGLQIMLMASSWLTLFLAIETVSITSYILTAFKFDKRSSEGGMKYLIFGAFSSALMLYGVSFLYGFSGTLDLVKSIAHPAVAQSLMGQVALVLSLAGLVFKTASVPLHIWSPDVYEVAPTSLVAFFSVAPKSAAILVLHRFCQIEGLPDALIWSVAVLSMVSILVGNLAALGQRKLKRMLAYSSIAHAGFLLVAVLSSEFNTVIFFLGVYLLMNFLAFGLAKFIEHTEGNDMVEMAETFKKMPIYLGVCSLIVATSFVGLPITAGFTAKLLIFSDLWQFYAQSEDTILITLFVIGLANAVVSLFYYFKLPFFSLVKRNSDLSYSVSFGQKLFFGALSIFLILLFFKPDFLLNLL